MQSVWSRLRLASHSLTIQRRELPNWFGSLPIVPWTLVARTTSSRRPLRALPTISSDSPRLYTSAVSMKLIPASRARWMIRIDSFSSLLPQSPNIMAPRHSGLTYMPVRPRVRWSIAQTLLPAIASARGGEDRGGDPAGLDEREVRVRIALGDGVDGDLGVEPDTDDVIAAGGEVAGDGELLRGRARDAQLALGTAAGGGHRTGRGIDGRIVTAGGLVDHDHEPRRNGRLALGLEHEPGHAQRQHGQRKREEELVIRMTVIRMNESVNRPVDDPLR